MSDSPGLPPDPTQVHIVRSARKTLSIQVKDCCITVRVPFSTSNTEIRRFLEKNRDWICRQLEKQQAAQAAAQPVLTRQELEALARRAAQVIPQRVRYYAPLVGVTYGRITIRNQKTRWGSCSRQGNLNFNCLLMLTPLQVLDSVVVHELCHRKEMNHSRNFYREVLRVFPEYYKWHAWLKENGDAIMRRNP